MEDHGSAPKSREFSILIDESLTGSDKSRRSAAPISSLPQWNTNRPQSYENQKDHSADQKVSYIKRVRFRPLIANISVFVYEWTPFLLVGSYFVFSTTIYMVCTDGMISVFWFVYMATNFYVAATTVLEAFMSIQPCREARQAVSRLSANNFEFPTPEDQLPIIDFLILAYLPNEKDIIMDQALYALNKIAYPLDKIRINILYNTPKPIEPLQTQLQALTKEFPHCRVISVPNSTSKADNLNHFFTLDTGSDIIAIYDCDHFPHPYSPRWAAERFCQDENIQIVQGRCIVYNSKDSLLTQLVTVEFDKIYAVSHPGRAVMMDFALFCGSNGYWKADLLKKIKMDESMLTEDIDSALRAFSMGAKCVHELNVISYEQAPSTLSAFWKQRLRWAQGWTQASMKHLRLAYNKSPEGALNSKRLASQRFGIFSLLFIREWSYYLVTQYTCLVFGFVITKFPKNPTELLRFIYFQYPVSLWLFFISIICLIATLWITNRVKSEFVSRWMVIQFSLLYPLYLVLMATIGLYGHARQIVKYAKWNPTARG